MKNQIKQKVEKALQNTKGFTLVELIVVTVIIMILATMATTSYLRFVEDAKVAKDTAYIKGVITQIETLIAKDKLIIPTANKTTENADDSYILVINADGTWWSDFDDVPSEVPVAGSDSAKNQSTIQENCTKQELTSTAAKAADLEIRVQIYDDVPTVFVYCKSADADDYWYPYTMEWAGEGSW